MNVFSLFGEIAVDAKPYHKALSETETATTKTGATLNKTWDKNLKQTEKRLGEFGKRMQAFGKSWSLYVTAPIVGAGAAILAVAGNFEQSMNKVSAISGAVGRDFDRLRDQAKMLGETTRYSATEAADAMTFLAMAGYDVDTILRAMPETLQLAASANLDLAQAADIVTNVMSGFGIEADKLGGAVDVLAKAFTSSNTDLTQLGDAFKYAGPVAKGAGQSFEETAAILGMMGNAGIQASMAGTSLRGAITRLLNPTKQVQEVISRLGIETKDSSGNLLSMVDIVGQLEDKGASTADMMTLFGQRAGPAMAALVEQGTGSIRDLVAALEDSAGTAAGIAAKQMEGFKGAMIELRSATEGLMIAIASSGLLEWAEKLAKRVTGIVRSLTSLDSATLGTITVIAGLVAAIGPLAIGLGLVSNGLAAALAGLQSLRLVALAASGPAGWIAALALIVGVTLVKAWRDHDKAVDQAIVKTEAVRDALAGANDKQALHAVVTALANDLAGNAKEAFIVYAAQAIASAGDVNEAADLILQAHARIVNSAEITRVQQSLALAKAQRDSAASNVAVLSSGADAIRSRITELEGLFDKQGTLSYEATQELLLLQQELETGGTITEAQFERGRESVAKLNTEVEQLEGSLAALTGTTRELSSEPVEVNVTPTVVPDTRAGGTPDNPTGLPQDGDVIEVEIRYKPIVLPDGSRGDGGIGMLIAEEDRIERNLARIRAEWQREFAKAYQGHAPRGDSATLERDVHNRLIGDRQHRPHAGDGGLASLLPEALRLERNLERIRGEIQREFTRNYQGFSPRGDNPNMVRDAERRLHNDAIGAHHHRPRAGDGGLADARAAQQAAYNAAYSPFRPDARGDGGVSHLEFNQRAGDRAVQSDAGLRRGNPNEAAQLAEAHLINMRREVEERRNLVASLTTVTSEDGPVDAFSKSLLGVVVDGVPLFSAALEGFVTAGPLGLLTSVFSELLGRSEAFLNILDLLNNILDPIVNMFDMLFTALTPIVEVAVALVETALQPLTLIIKHIVTPVFTAVANVIKAIWNGIARALNAILGWLGVRVPLIGESGSEADMTPDIDAPPTTPDPPIRNTPARERGEVQFGGTPHAVQFAVATPLVEAAYTMLEAASSIKSAFSGVGGDSFGSSVTRFGDYVDRLVTEGINVKVAQLSGTGQASGTAYLR